MTRLVFNKTHFYEEVTPGAGPSFSQVSEGQTYSIALKAKDDKNPKVGTQVFLYLGKYIGLNRALCDFEFNESPEELLDCIMNECQSLEIEFKAPVDYFGTRRATSAHVSRSVEMPTPLDRAG